MITRLNYTFIYIISIKLSEILLYNINIKVYLLKPLTVIAQV